MYRFFLSLALAAVCSTHLSAQTASSLNLYFGYDLDQLTDEHRSQLSTWVESLQCDSMYFVISGHTDNHASDEYNVALSQRRVNAAISGLKELGFSEENMRSSRHGEFKPVATNEEDQGRALNRRVEIIVEGCGSSDQDTVPYAENISSELDSILSLLGAQPQKFTIHSNQDTMLVLNKGTVVHVRKGTFVNGRGDVISNDSIDLEIIEVVDYADMVAADVVTLAGKEIIQTGGMIKLNATRDGDDVDMALPFNVGFAAQDYTDYRSFQGVSHDDGPTTWRGNNTNLRLALNPYGFEWWECHCRIITERCPFWCRVGNWLRGESHLSTTTSVRYGRCNYRGWVWSLDGTTLTQDSLDKLVIKYNVTNLEYLFDSVYKKEINEYGVKTYWEYLEALEIERMEQAREKFATGTAKMNDLNQFLPVFQGWYNLDRYQKLDKRDQTRIYAYGIRSNETFVRLMVPDHGVCVPPTSRYQRRATVEPLEKGVDVTVIAVEMRNGKIFFAKEMATDVDNTRIDLNFEEVTFEELQHEFETLGSPLNFASTGF